MSNTYKMITLVGCSPDSYDKAVANAVADASRTLRNLEWLEVKEMRGRIDGGRVVEYQAKIQVGVKVEQ